jgi:small-conductance mechanosensitive channel
MAGSAELTGDISAVVDRIDAFAIDLEHGAMARLDGLRQAGHELLAVHADLAARGFSLTTSLLILIAAAALTWLLMKGAMRLFTGYFGVRQGLRRASLLAAAAITSLAVMMVATRILVADEALRSAIRLWSLATILGVAMQHFLRAIFASRRKPIGSAAHHGSRQRRFHRLVTISIYWALIGLAVNTTLRDWNAGLGLRDLVGTGLVATPISLLLIYAYGRYHLIVTAMIAGPRRMTQLRRFALAWPWIAIALIVITYVATQVALLLGILLPPIPTFLTLLLVLTAPHLDTVLARWGHSASSSVLVVALRRTIRFIVAACLLLLLGYLWVLPLLTLAGVGTDRVRSVAVEIALIALASAFLWNVIGAFSSRIAQTEGHTGSAVELAGPRSRLGTLLPLVSGTGKAAVFALSFLTMLIAFGINVWPILTGLSVFGLAIGFGSQTLVKDIVSGLFFLVDDAFRLGEYVETSGAKGTVEKISIRSVSLRSARGPLATVPYGQIGKVVNFSRDWVIEKLVFRVAFDTDVEQVRKLFKKVGQDIADDPDINADLLEPFKSQGIAAVEDGTLLIRGKFKARAGKQFAIRKAVLTGVQQAFRDNDIRVSPKMALPTPQPVPPSPAIEAMPVAANAAPVAQEAPPASSAAPAKPAPAAAGSA